MGLAMVGKGWCLVQLGTGTGPRDLGRGIAEVGLNRKKFKNLGRRLKLEWKHGEPTDVIRYPGCVSGAACHVILQAPRPR